mgnify:CR=1 FL=1
MEGEATGQRDPDTDATLAAAPASLAEPLAGLPLDVTRAAMAQLDGTRTRLAPSRAEVGEVETRVRDSPLAVDDGPPGATDLARGALIGRYVVLDKLGAGAMGVVYCAFDPELDRKVAIKLLKPETGGSTMSESQAARARLLREAQALAKLGHPNVVAVHDVGTHGDDVWIAMEFVKGQTLTRWRQQRQHHRGGWREVLDVMTRAGQGLAAAHAVGLIHRDVKPDNVMVGDDGRVRMMDFGLARRGAGQGLAPEELDIQAVGAGERAMLRIEVTQVGAMIGTPAYMAPEQFAGRVPGPAADVFGFCVMLWEGLHGTRPFGGQTIAELRANILADRRLAPARSSGAPRWLLRVLNRGLASEPERRWQTMGELLAELDRGHARRRRWQVVTAIGGLLAVVGGGLGTHELSRRQSIAACEAEGAVIVGDWNDDVKAGLERAFLATGKPGAATTLEKTLPWLDRWASTWQAATAGACEAHRLDRTLDDELYARAVDCLDEAHGTFTALVHELGAADGITIVRATSAAAGLSRADRCLEATVLRSRPPLTPEHADAVKRLRARFARVGSLRAAGNFAGGLAIAEDALLGAREVAWPAVVAEGEYRVGQLAGDQGDYARAEASLLRALAGAREARAPRLALDTMTHLVWIVGDRAARAAEGKVWAESAQTELTLWLADDPLAQAQLDNNLGLVHHYSGGYDEAARLHARALAGWIAVLGEQHPQVAQSLNNLANARASQGATEEAIGLHERALAIREVALGAEHPQVAASLSNLGIAYLKLGRSDAALRVQTRALAIREAALTPDHPDLIESLNNIATVHENLQDHAAALPFYLRALAILERTPGANPRMLATVLYNCANIDEAQGHYAEAAQKHERSLAGFEALLGKDHPNLTYPLEGLADVRLELGDHDEALRLRLRALAIREKVRGKDHPEVAISLTGLARVQRKRGALAEALALDTRARTILEATGKDGPELARPLLGLGETHLLARDPAAALASLERALPLLGTGDEHREPLARVRFALARALWEARTDRPRALALAASAREGLAATPTPGAALREVDEWIAAHRE